MDDINALLDWCREHHDEEMAVIGRVVDHDSPTSDKPALDRLAAVLEECLEEAGADRVTRYPQDDAGDHLLAVWDFPAREEGREDLFAGDDRPALILCHYDTVWGPGDAARRPFRIEGDRAFGPGVFDMKAGLVQGIFAVRALVETEREACRPVWMLITSDEEVGSRTSRTLIEDLAQQCAYVLVLEPAVGPTGLLKTWRKGVGVFRLTVRGRAAHAGADHAEGVSAVEELAHQILRLQAMTDHSRGTTVNVGVVRGGTRSNVVPDSAEAEIDLRVMTRAEGERMTAAIRGLKPVLQGTTLRVDGGMNRPPMERTPAIAAMFAVARRLGAEIGLDLGETGTGGGSDGNLTAALGVPTLDGLGAVGHGAHSLDEYILVHQVPLRTALVARLLEVL
ncbi:MAG: M20 family metallopeptidase [Thermaerobacter sp.]